jgi:hypothetical protein
MPETEIYAVCTAHADTAQAAADKYGVKHAYSDIKKMGADQQVEAALVAVRVPAHYALSKDALEAGKHVYASGRSARPRRKRKSWPHSPGSSTCAPWSACSGARRPRSCTCASW